MKLYHFVSITEVFLKCNLKSRCIGDTSIFLGTTICQPCDGWSSRCKYNADCIMQFEHAPRETCPLLRSTKSNLQFGHSYPFEYFVRRALSWTGKCTKRNVPAFGFFILSKYLCLTVYFRITALKKGYFVSHNQEIIFYLFVQKI